MRRPSDAIFAEEWIAACFQLQQGAAPSPRQKEEIRRAVGLLRQQTGGRSLTDFVATVQDVDIRAALGPYTIEGSLGHLLDARADAIEENAFTVFEIDELMALGEKNLIPVLLYLFRHFERSLTGAPALLLLDEAWIMLGHPVFREKIREWLKVLRKANCAVVLATQSLSDAVRSGIFDVLLESCPTKILLPNEEADKGGDRASRGPARPLHADRPQRDRDRSPQERDQEAALLRGEPGRPASLRTRPWPCRARFHGRFFARGSRPRARAHGRASRALAASLARRSRRRRLTRNGGGCL